MISCILAFFCLIQTNLLVGEETKEATLAEIINSDVQTLFKDNLHLDSILSNDINIIVFYSDYTCKDCFKKIAKEIEDMKSEDQEINLIVLLRCSLFNKYRKDMYREAKKIFNTDNIYFDIHNKEDKWPPVDLEEGIFGMFPIVQTPAILKISEGKSKIEFKSYADLFQNKDPKKSILELP